MDAHEYLTMVRHVGLSCESFYWDSKFQSSVSSNVELKAYELKPVIMFELGLITYSRYFDKTITKFCRRVFFVPCLNLDNLRTSISIWKCPNCF